MERQVQIGIAGYRLRQPSVVLGVPRFAKQNIKTDRRGIADGQLIE